MDAEQPLCRMLVAQPLSIQWPPTEWYMLLENTLFCLRILSGSLKERQEARPAALHEVTHPWPG